jgi:hypothetical protein
MKKIIKKILKEDRRQMFLDKIIKFIKNDFPLFKNLKDYGFYEQLSEDEINYVLSGIFGKLVRIGGLGIYDENNNEIYFEEPDGFWEKREFDENNNMIYQENSSGGYEKHEYDDNGHQIYFENYDGEWRKWEYDDRGREIYYEDSDGYIEDKR